MTSSRSWILVSAGVALVAFGAGWVVSRFGGKGMAQEARSHMVSKAIPPRLPAWEAPSAGWEEIWQQAKSPAHREVLLAAWMERNPEAVLTFLRRRPPLGLLNQKSHERMALLAWGKREPLPAYVFACHHHGEYVAADEILEECLQRDVNLGLRLIEEGPYRNGFSHGDFSWIRTDPARICERLAAMKPGFLQDDFLKEASRTWAEADLEAARAFALGLPGPRADVALSGILAAVPPAKAAELLMQAGSLGRRGQAVQSLMNRWGREDAVAAAAWAVESLPPAVLPSAMTALALNVLPYPQYASDEALPGLLGQLSPAAWQALSKGPASLEPLLSRVLPHAPDWIVEDLANDWLKQEAKSLLEPANHPAWFTQLTQERIAELVKLQVLATKDY